jgi:hypothetical protein
MPKTRASGLAMAAAPPVWVGAGALSDAVGEPEAVVVESPVGVAVLVLVVTRVLDGLVVDGVAELDPLGVIE